MLQGSLPALVTPFTDGALDLATLKKLVEWHIAEGSNGLVPVGTTGESPTLTHAEHETVVAEVVKAAAGRIPVVAGAGSNNTTESIRLAKHAESVGADAVLVVTPYYNKPTQAGLLAHFEALAAATDLPMVLYNVPGRTSCDMLPATVAEAAKLAGVVAIKEATGDLRRAAQVISSVPDGFTVLSGDDFTCMPFCALGGHGVISVVSNLMPAETSQMIQAVRDHDLDRARKLQYKLMPLMDQLFVESNPIPVKAGAALLGFTDNELRLPLTPLEGDALEALGQRLKGLGRLGS